MISKSQRLGRKAFTEAFKRGRRRTLPFFLVIQDNSQAKAHFAVVVPKKIAKTAVLRNKIRRRMYEAIRRSPLVGASGAFIFVCRKGIEDKGGAELDVFLKTLANQMSII
ncbi:MAG: ribonuclease P protein component [Candidatus Taylorbacteria bacterium]|nr:ribonuclease P protein component [Candidatus Taylorbacteria bacterium]